MSPRLQVEYDLTIAIAIRESDTSILLAADGQATGKTIKVPIKKLRQVPNTHILWAASGNPEIGITEFGEWLYAYPWLSSIGWPQFASDAIEALARLNGRQRQRAELSGLEAREEDLADCPIAGWVGGEPGIYALSTDGRLTEVWHLLGFWALGSGVPHAVAVNMALDLDGRYAPEDKLHRIMEVVVRTAPDCGDAIQGVRITPDEIVPLFSATLPASQSETDSNAT